ncbi:MAG: RsmD family RNA methyltransferase [Bacteroidota bacterium]|nr:RsmD family RNA methyltransferase [Bacteroidota bacterium]MDX5447945.1 RsmD family RNA methyltransferase [Bacteroidota bacterium]MDX5506996.1 RsmD family RNA methyltransferase [Bacteroidota bacterium]
MRIVSGKFRGKIIVAPKNLPVRPTTDMAKESLFNILNNYYHFDQVEVLDLFAGTGNITYEFGSRGTESITAVDLDRDCTRFIRKTSEAMGLDSVKVYQEDAIQFLKKAYQTWDIIFADPPYDHPQVEQIPDVVLDRELLKEGGMLVLEHSEDHDFSDHPGFYDSRKYGRVHFTLFIPESDQE